jgi:hypothetical protein
MTPELVKVAIARADGSAAVMMFITVGRGSVLPAGASWISEGVWMREPNQANLSQEIRRAFPDVMMFRVVDDKDIPGDREYRDALKADLTYDMSKARNIFLTRLRAKRALTLEQLDRDWMRATGQGKKQEAQQIEGARQALRDLPQDFENKRIDTIEDLKAL